MLNLIPRLYDVTEGQVLVDDVDVRDYDTEVLRNKIGFVPQKAVLFSGTIDSNIAFGEEIPICVFNIDNSKLSGGLEFYLNNAIHWLDIFPKPEYEFRELVNDVATLLDKPIEDPLISEYVRNFIENLNIEDEEKKKRKIILLLIFTIFVPLILIAISFATFDISGNLGTLLFLLAIAFFIGSPVFYLVYNYMMK